MPRKRGAHGPRSIFTKDALGGYGHSVMIKPGLKHHGEKLLCLKKPAIISIDQTPIALPLNKNHGDGDGVPVPAFPKKAAPGVSPAPPFLCWGCAGIYLPGNFREISSLSSCFLIFASRSRLLSRTPTLREILPLSSSIWVI